MAREVIKVKLVVTDVNDNSPLFSRSLLEVDIRENVAIGVPVHTVQARDVDSGGNGSVR